MGIYRRLNQAWNTRLQVVYKNITVADLTAAALAQTIAFDDTMPSDAMVIGAQVVTETALSGGGAGNATVDVGEDAGTGDIDAYIDGANVFTGAPTPISTPRGVGVPGQGASVTPSLTVRSNVNVNTLTAGDITALVYYISTTQV
jgi:hypothetical protein